MQNLLYVEYQQTGKSAELNTLGMREMQARAYEKRNAQYLLLKAPPASGKSRALMFLALDKLQRQGIRKAVICVPEMAIGGSFADTDLRSHGFFANWQIAPQYNLCLTEGGDKQKVAAFKRFIADEKAQILLCTHATFRFAAEQLQPQDFNQTLVAIDEFHHVSANENNKLGYQLDRIMQGSNAHIIAMTGSYFRGDAMPILSPEDEAKFEQVVYTYYDQLNGYRYLKSLGLGYHFYKAIDGYFGALAEVLDTTKKTIIHIPNVNSAESTKQKYQEVDRILDLLGEIESEQNHIYHIRTADGRLLKVADLVNDDPDIRPKVVAYLRNIKQAGDLDMIIALGMAKEGFDWTFCEHALTIGYRSSLTEVVQIIGRATRDCEGKSHAQFTNLIASPDASDDEVKNAVNSLLKAITLSLLMEQVLAPNIHFRPRSKSEEGEPLPAGTVVVDGIGDKPVSDRVISILNGSRDDIMAALLQNENVATGILGDTIATDTLREILIPNVVREKFPDLSEEEVEQVVNGIWQALIASQNGGVVQGTDLPPDVVVEGTSEGDIATSQFIKMGDKFINIDSLNIDLIAAINPFYNAFAVLSKNITPEMLKAIQTVAASQKIQMTEEEARMLWGRIQQFIREKGRQPSLSSREPLEKRMAEAIIYLRNKKAEQMRAKP